MVKYEPQRVSAYDTTRYVRKTYHLIDESLKYPYGLCGSGTPERRADIATRYIFIYEDFPFLYICFQNTLLYVAI